MPLTLGTATSLLILMFMSTSAHAANMCTFLFELPLTSQAPKTLALDSVTPGEPVVTPSQPLYGEHAVSVKATAREADGSKLKKPKIPITIIRTQTGIRYLQRDQTHTAIDYAREKEAQGATRSDVKIKPISEIDRPQWTDAEMMRYLRDNDIVYVPKGYKIRDDWTFEKNWPKTVFDLNDSPLRSLMKLVFQKWDLRGKEFNDFIQFRVADLAIEKGYKLPKEITYSEEQVQQLYDFIRSQPEILAFLFSQSRTLQKLLPDLNDPAAADALLILLSGQESSTPQSEL